MYLALQRLCTLNDPHFAFKQKLKFNARNRVRGVSNSFLVSWTGGCGVSVFDSQLPALVYWLTLDSKKLFLDDIPHVQVRVLLLFRYLMELHVEGWYNERSVLLFYPKSPVLKKSLLKGDMVASLHA